MEFLEQRINSVELCELINMFRVEEKGTEAKKYEHKDLMKKIRKELETMEKLGLVNGGNISLVEYVDKKGESRPCYSLNASGMRQILNSESTYVRCKTEEYIAKLEKQVQKDPREPLLLNIYEGGVEAVVAARELVELEKKPLLDKIEEQTPKAEYFDKVLDPKDEENGFTKLITTTDIAKDLGMSARKLNKLLNDKGIIYKQGNSWKVYTKYEFLIKEKYCDYKVNEFGQILKWTEKGRRFIIETVLNN